MVACSRRPSRELLRYRYWAVHALLDATPFADKRVFAVCRDELYTYLAVRTGRE
jgi:hypothetical protein